MINYSMMVVLLVVLIAVAKEKLYCTVSRRQRRYEPTISLHVISDLYNPTSRFCNSLLRPPNLFLRPFSIINFS